MSEYMAIARSSAANFEPVPVALAAGTTKTVLQVAVPSTTDIRVIGWGVSFDGASGTAVPVICSLSDLDTAATTGTSLTPETWGNATATASLCIGGAALTAYNLTVETAPSAAPRMLDAQHVHPQAGYGIIWPEVRWQPRVAPSRFVRLRCKAPAIVNVIPWCMWTEPSILSNLPGVELSTPTGRGVDLSVALRQMDNRSKILGPAVTTEPRRTKPGWHARRRLGPQPRLDDDTPPYPGTGINKQARRPSLVAVPLITGLGAPVSPPDVRRVVVAVVIPAVQGHAVRPFTEQFNDLPAEGSGVVPGFPDGDPAGTVVPVVAVTWPVAAAHDVMPGRVPVVVVAEAVGGELLARHFPFEAAAGPGAVGLVEQVVGADGAFGTAVAAAGHRVPVGGVEDSPPAEPLTGDERVGDGSHAPYPT